MSDLIFLLHETPNLQWKNTQGQSSKSSVSSYVAATACSKIVDGKKGEEVLTFFK